MSGKTRDRDVETERHPERQKKKLADTQRETEQGRETVRDRETSDRANWTGTAEPPPDPTASQAFL